MIGSPLLRGLLASTLVLSSGAATAQVKPQWQPLMNLLSTIRDHELQKAQEAESKQKIDSGESTPEAEQQKMNNLNEQLLLNAQMEAQTAAMAAQRHDAQEQRKAADAAAAQQRAADAAAAQQRNLMAAIAADNARRQSEREQEERALRAKQAAYNSSIASSQRQGSTKYMSNDEKHNCPSGYHWTIRTEGSKYNAPTWKCRYHDIQ